LAILLHEFPQEIGGSGLIVHFGLPLQLIESACAVGGEAARRDWILALERKRHIERSDLQDKCRHCFPIFVVRPDVPRQVLEDELLDPGIGAMVDTDG
jgi:hypothetical protein